MGADYRPDNKGPIYWAGKTTFAANLTNFFSAESALGLEPAVAMPVPYACHIRNLFARSSVAPGAGETYTLTLYLNGAPTALTCQIAGAVDQQASDLVNQIAVAQGENISIRLVTSLNAATTRMKIGMEARG